MTGGKCLLTTATWLPVRSHLARNLAFASNQVMIATSFMINLIIFKHVTMDYDIVKLTQDSVYLTHRRVEARYRNDKIGTVLLVLEYAYANNNSMQTLPRVVCIVVVVCIVLVLECYYSRVVGVRVENYIYI